MITLTLCYRIKQTIIKVYYIDLFKQNQIVKITLNPIRLKLINWIPNSKLFSKLKDKQTKYLQLLEKLLIKTTINI